MIIRTDIGHEDEDKEGDEDEDKYDDDDNCADEASTVLIRRLLKH